MVICQDSPRKLTQVLLSSLRCWEAVSEMEVSVREAGVLCEEPARGGTRLQRQGGRSECGWVRG